MYDVIIIGAGPAGISASLYSKRAGMNVLVLYYGESNLEKATEIDNYYGFENGIDGKVLYYNGIKQAQNLDIEVKNEEVINIEKMDNNFIVSTVYSHYEGKTVIIATGNKKLRPNIKGVLEFEGKGVSYCAICDGFFYRNKNVAVIGNGKFAISEANELKNIANKVTILSDGLPVEDASDLEFISKKIKEIKGDKKVQRVEFEDGTDIEVDVVFIALGEARCGDFAKKLGVIVENDNLVVTENMQTNVEGLYSCGNSTGGLLQVCKAVYEGAKAGLAAANYIREVLK